MKIVIDANRVIASLIKKSTTREILFNNYFEFYAPSFIKSELYKYKDEMIKKAVITEEYFETILNLFFENIIIVNEQEYIQFESNFKDKSLDIKDIPYLAVCLQTNSKGVWTHDPHFKKQNKIKVFSNIDMLNIIRENSE